MTPQSLRLDGKGLGRHVPARRQTSHLATIAGGIFGQQPAPGVAGSVQPQRSVVFQQLWVEDHSALEGALLQHPLAETMKRGDHHLVEI